MRVGQIMLLLIAQVAVVGARGAAQEQKPEFLIIPNPTDQPVKVYLWAHGSDPTRNLRPDTDWQDAVTIDAHTENSAVQLHGIQPFDILIRVPDGTDIYFRKSNICTWMRTCQRTGQRDYTARVLVGRWVKDASGHLQWIRSSEFDLRTTADADTVRIPILPVLFPGTSTPPQTPVGGPKR
jgi:hypothetical protein